MLITYENFIRDIFIPQRSQLEVREEIELYIQTEEPAFLKKVLGEELFEAFMSGLEEDPIPAEWIDLRDILVDSVTKVSPVANYVYVKLLEDSVTKTTGIGELLPTGENGLKASPVQKIVQAWNKMVDMVCANHSKIRALDLPDYAYQDRESICSSDFWEVCGCKKDAVFKYRNTLGL